ncbi:hypothetical protein, partial [Ruminococcus bromii]|uniref:hypothetical protein n=1 Tax=Ruminococcus bromii TaxID=40518 RepID=UPI00266F4268
RNFGADKQYKLDYLFENCSSVKKTVLRTVFSCAAEALPRGPEVSTKRNSEVETSELISNINLIISLRTEELYELL